MEPSTGGSGVPASQGATGKPRSLVRLPVIAVWKDGETGARQHLGTFRTPDANSSSLMAELILDPLGLHLLRLHLYLPLPPAGDDDDSTANPPNGQPSESRELRAPHASPQFFGAAICHSASGLGPVSTDVHRLADFLRGRVAQLRQADMPPDFVWRMLRDKARGCDGREMRFEVVHAPSVCFQTAGLRALGVRGRLEVLAHPDVQDRLRRMRSLARAQMVRLFFADCGGGELDLEEVVGHFNAVPVRGIGSLRGVMSSEGYLADEEEQWKALVVPISDTVCTDWGAKPNTDTAKDSASGKGFTNTKMDVVQEIKRKRHAGTADGGEKASADHKPKRQRLKQDANGWKSLVLALPPPSSRGGIDGRGPGATTGIPSARVGSASAPPLNSTAAALAPDTDAVEASITTAVAAMRISSVRIAPTTNLAERWTEWWQFVYGSLGADRTDATYMDLMWRTMQAARDNDNAGFAAGLVDSAVYSLDIGDGMEEWSVVNPSDQPVDAGTFERRLRRP